MEERLNLFQQVILLVDKIFYKEVGGIFLALPYPRKFNVGRGSELIYNEELHKNFEATRHLLDKPEGDIEPKTPLDGALWLKRKDGKNHLKTWVKARNQYVNLFEEKFKITDYIMSANTPKDPVEGQLWIYRGVMLYYNGSQWEPIRAQQFDALQFDVSVFEDFIFASPLWKHGNTIVEDKDIETFLEARRKYLQGKIDFMADSTLMGDGTKWKIGDKIKDGTISLNEFKLEGQHQFVVPRLEFARIFANNKLDWSYQAENQFTIKYPKHFLLGHKPSMVHVNPGRLCSIKKRLFRIDKQNPRIPVPTKNTEYYGFRLGEHGGHFLLPEETQDDGGYIRDNDFGVILSYNQAQNYDYALSVTFEFETVRPTGTIKHFEGSNLPTSYFLPALTGTDNVFVEGFILEGTAYKKDNVYQTIKIDENTSTAEVQVMKSGTREYGFVRDMTVDGKAIIRVLHDFNQPLVFVGGEVMNPAEGEVSYDRDKNTFTVQNGRLNMPWVVFELSDHVHPARDKDGDLISAQGNKKAGYKITHNLDGTEIKEGPYLITGRDSNNRPMYDETMTVEIIYYDMLESLGIVSKKDQSEQGVIDYTTEDFSTEDILDENGVKIGERVLHAVLFIDGLMVKREDLIIDKTNKTITTKNLRVGQDFILLKDKHDYFVDTKDLLPALDTGKLSESLVYLNGELLCNKSAFTQTIEPTVAKDKAAHQEIMYFLDAKTTTGKEVMEYDDINKKWLTLTPQVKKGLLAIIDSYENMPSTIGFKIPWSRIDDRLDVYVYNYANDVEHSLIIRNLPSQYDDPESVFDAKNKLLRDVMTGDAPEIAKNGIHFFEKDIREAITKLPDEFLESLPMDPLHAERSKIKAREEAIKNLNLTPKYSTVYYHQFDIDDQYIMNIGSLCVYVNGVRQYYIEEIKNNRFAIPWPVKGVVTYTIELPEHGNSAVAIREIIDSKNTLNDLTNVYRTTASLYAGKLSVYINGIRQPHDAYTIIDAHTIMFLEKDTRLIGNVHNYPDENILNLQGKPTLLHHSLDDKILIEIFYEYKWKEDHIKLEQSKQNFIIPTEKYNLTQDLIRTNDELKIYIDGLFFGLKDHDGYQRNRNSEVLTITRTDVIERLLGDTLYDYLIKDKNAMKKYVNIQNEKLIRDLMASTYNMTRDEAIKHLKNLGLYDQERKPYIKDMIIEWR